MGRGHCTKCGAKMIYRQRSRRVQIYSDLDGQPWYAAENVCPNRRHRFDGHNRDRGQMATMALPLDSFDELLEPQ
jgi:hypothetical protein